MLSIQSKICPNFSKSISPWFHSNIGSSVILGCCTLVTKAISESVMPSSCWRYWINRWSFTGLWRFGLDYCAQNPTPFRTKYTEISNFLTNFLKSIQFLLQWSPRHRREKPLGMELSLQNSCHFYILWFLQVFFCIQLMYIVWIVFCCFRVIAAQQGIIDIQWFHVAGDLLMSILHDGQTWEVIDMTWDGWVAVLIENGCRTHYRAFLPFQETTGTSTKARRARDRNH